MLGRKTGLPQNLNSHHRMKQSYQEAVPLRSRPSKESDVSLEVFSGSTPEIKQSRNRAQQMRDRRGRKADLKDSYGREAETITFISGTAEAPQAQSLCCSSLSQAWNTYKAVFCCIVTCGGCFQDCSVCITYPGPAETSTDDGKNGDYNGRLPNSPANVSPTEKNGNQIKKTNMGSSFSYPDVKLKGIPVYQNRSPSHHLDSDSCCKELLPDKPLRNSIEKAPLPSSHRSSEEYYSFHESDLDISELNGSMSSREIDVLIFKKLTELFSVHQIDELAKCTSDTVFLEKTNKISDLINSITQDYNLDEQDAECRLVRGIIRISTRKSRVRPHISIPASQSHEEKSSRGNPPDSGNETMLESMVISQDDLAVQISEETPADVIARNMRRHSSAGSPTSRDSSFQDTETDSSGAPLLQVYC
ncbi:keratinocyte differentiation factor 1 isoform X1 [Dromaius novaehollandiae]|uniref:Keratinocyte differentiation factor 1 n=2 Tax=Dromaius novaehollandiae TaxID=8790 RepID=A0A8C4JK94_DRONO|nr:keratinocyte differentiation factor 1 [Dromaius novaehollandiae]XP_025954025.1 keratinocyte differentiation factor 1 [Dromaius novaehollandiae]XP_025954026.1 keratinocyte differentiation factor 1 [Dromaius novaehollandiae]XP_025954027.1 keratinocyte differentiation factor 1 [Dromaius novaehollandiae]XP_025954028.1 keratinocyte differentiation factor 1 [Dromaius novaehollandiae]